MEKEVIKKISIKNGIISCLGALFCMLACLSDFFSVSGELYQASGIVAPFVYVLSLIAIYHLLQNFSAREMWSSIPAAVVLAACQRIGSEFAINEHVEIGNYRLYASIFCISVLFWVIITYILHYIDSLGEIVSRADGVFNRIFSALLNNEKEYKGVLTKNTCRVFFLFFGVLILFWIPAVLATYPGVFSYDAISKAVMGIGEEKLTDHAPIFSTLLLTGCMKIGKTIGGDYVVGVFVYTLVQMLIMSFSFSYALTWMWNSRIPKVITILGLIFFAINPIVQILVLTTTHDTIFGGLLLLLVVEILDMSVHTSWYFASWKNIVRFIFLAFLMCMFRNQGLYMLIFLTPFIVIALKKYRIKVLLVFMVPIIIVAVLTRPVYKALDIYKYNKAAESLSVPIQQIARLVNMNREAITDEECSEIYKFIPKENIEQYNPKISDPVKVGFDNDYYSEHKGDFYKLWLSLGLRNGSIYFDSFMYGAYGYFYLEKTPVLGEYIMYDGASTQLNYKIGFERRPKLAFYDNYLRNVSFDMTLDKIPIISILTNEAFPFWIMMFMVSLLILKKRWKNLAMLVLPFGYWGTLLLGPIIGVRYAFPLIVLVPLFLGICFCKEGK